MEHARIQQDDKGRVDAEHASTIHVMLLREDRELINGELHGNGIAEREKLRRFLEQ